MFKCAKSYPENSKKCSDKKSAALERYKNFSEEEEENREDWD